MRGRISFAAFVLALTIVLAAPDAAPAQDIPKDVRVNLYLKPEGERLYLLTRVPLAAMRDVEFPQTPSGYLDLERVDSLLPAAATRWIANAIEVYEEAADLPDPRVVETRVSVQSDPSFASYDEAWAHLTGPKLPAATQVVWNQAMLDVLFEYPILSEQSGFAIHPGLARLGSRVVTVLRFLPPPEEGSRVVRAFEFDGDPGLIRLDPSWGQAALRFVKFGFFRILEAPDYLLFLLCLVIPLRRFAALLPVVTAFAVAHSITLIASAYSLGPDALWFPPFIETLIAASILFLALENIASESGVQRRWMMAFGFGLVYGFGFAFALSQTLQFAGTHRLTSLLSFTIGLELGLMAVLAVLIPTLALLFRFGVDERTGTIILSVLAAHTGWHWLIERWDLLRQFQFQWPEFNAAMLASAMRWTMLLLIGAGLIWLIFGVLGRRPRKI